MRHRSTRARLNQKPDHARLLQRNLVTSLLLYETIRTTKKRAIVMRPIVDKLVTIAKTKQPHIAIRSINAVVTDRNASRKLMEVLAKRYEKRPSGFTRMTAVGSRKGDGADLVDITLVDAFTGIEEQAAAKKPVAKKKAVASKTSTPKKTITKDSAPEQKETSVDSSDSSAS